MKNSITLLLIVGCTVITQTFAQTKFKATYPDVTITSASETKDHGYIISGYSSSYGIGSNDIVMIKTDSVGNMTWKKTYGNSANSGADDVAANAVESGDGSFYLSGQLWNQSNNTYEIYVLKTDSAGEKLWSKTMYNGGYDKGMSVINLDDGCYVTGWVGNSSEGFLAKFDISGNIDWQETVSAFAGAWVLQPGRITNDGGLIAGGYDNELGSYEMWLVKTNSSGTIEWQKGYAMPGTYNFCYDVCETNDHGYLLGGGSSGINLVRTDSAGNVLWANTYLANYIYPRAYSVKQCNDGGFITLSNDLNNNEYLMKVDSVGAIEWTTEYSGNGYFINTVEQTSDGRFIFAIGDELIKTDENGLTNCDDQFVTLNESSLTLTTRVTAATATSHTQSSNGVDGSTDPAIPATIPCIGSQVKNISQPENGLNIYPTIVETTCSIIFKNAIEDAEIRIVDVMGKEFTCPSRWQTSSSGFQVEVDCSKLSQGFYFISVKTKEGILSQKFLKM